MRTYLVATDNGMVLKCDGCQNETDLRKLYGPSVAERAVGIKQVNTLRLSEFLGKYGMEHADCKVPSGQ